MNQLDLTETQKRDLKSDSRNMFLSGTLIAVITFSTALQRLPQALYFIEKLIPAQDPNDEQIGGPARRKIASENTNNDDERNQNHRLSEIK
jgi:hypothetical protein